MESIITACITGGLALVGIIITNISSNRTIENKLTTNQAVMNTKLDKLTEEVRTHNNFAMKIPVIENRLDTIEITLKEVQNEIK